MIIQATFQNLGEVVVEIIKKQVNEMNQKLHPDYVSKAQRDAELREVQKAHYEHPHRGIAPEVTPETIITFGKYQGTAIKDVPRHYLEYQALLCRQGSNLYTNNIFDQIRIYVEKTR